MPGIETLRLVPLFAGLSDADLASVAACMSTRAFGKGIFIQRRQSHHPPGRAKEDPVELPRPK